MTNDYATFEDSCADYKEDLKEKEIVLKKRLEAAGHEKSGTSTDYKKNKEYGAILFFVGVAIMLITMAQSVTFGGAIIPTGLILFGARKYMKGEEQEKLISQMMTSEEENTSEKEVPRTP